MTSVRSILLFYVVPGQSRDLIMTVLASKERYCINEEVLNYHDLTVDEICGHEKTVAINKPNLDAAENPQFSSANGRWI